MTVALVGTGGVLTRIGKIVKALRNYNGLRAETLAIGDGSGSGTTDTAAVWGASGPTVIDTKTAYDGIQGQYLSAQQDLISGSYSLYSKRDSMRQALTGACSDLQTLAINTVIRMVDDDAVLISKDLPTAMTELIRQMVVSADTIKYNVTSGSVAAASTNTGNPTFLVSLVNTNGARLEYVYPETIECKCTSDAGLGATAGSEPFSVTGEVAVTNPLDWNWPKGSGRSTSLTLVDPTVNSGTNLLYNSSFEAWGGVPQSDANCPTRWTKLVGSLGTSIVKDVTNVYRTGSTAAVKFVGDGAELTSISQTFGDSTNGTSTTLKPDTVYAFNARLYTATHPAAGVLVASLLTSGGTVINDDTGTANTITTTLSGVSDATWTAMSGFFRTPKVFASGYKLAIRLTTAMTNARVITIDDVALTTASSLYTGGPWIAGFRGSTDVVKNDQMNVTIAQDNGGIFQTYFDRLFGMRNMGLQIPSATGGGQTVSESLTS